MWTGVCTYQDCTSGLYSKWLKYFLLNYNIWKKSHWRYFCYSCDCHTPLDDNKKFKKAGNKLLEECGFPKVRYTFGHKIVSLQQLSICIKQQTCESMSSIGHQSCEGMMEEKTHLLHKLCAFRCSISSQNQTLRSQNQVKIF